MQTGRSWQLGSQPVSRRSRTEAIRESISVVTADSLRLAVTRSEELFSTWKMQVQAIESRVESLQLESSLAHSWKRYWSSVKCCSKIKWQQHSCKFTVSTAKQVITTSVVLVEWSMQYASMQFLWKICHWKYHPVTLILKCKSCRYVATTKFYFDKIYFIYFSYIVI